MTVHGNYSIQKGDTLWAIAKKQLQVSGNQTPSNAQIVQAMNDIAKANGCESPDECKEKFFNQIGSQIQVAGFNIEKSASSSAPVKDNSVLTVGQKTQIDNIRELNYDSPELKTNLDKNKNINTYAQYFETNTKYHVINNINHVDGSQTLIYGDESENYVGTVNKGADGTVENVSVALSDGAKISLNSRDRDDGDISSRILMSRNYPVSENKDKTTYNQALELMLSKYDSYEVFDNQNSDGSVVQTYLAEGKIVATVIKNAEGKISQVHQFDIPVKNGEEQKFFYIDIDGDGVIDQGDGITRFDKEL